MLHSAQDPAIGTGIPLLELIAAIQPAAVKPDLITPGDTPDNKQLNAKYAISLARKLGASVYCTWEDLMDVKPKMVMLFVATLMQTAQRLATK